MNEFVLIFFLVYLVLALMLAVLYERLVRWQIVHRVREAGGELLQVQRLRGQLKSRRAARQTLPLREQTYYVVKYRTTVGHELTRLCKLSLFGGVFWYDEE